MDEERRNRLIASSIGLAGLAVAAGAFYWLRYRQEEPPTREHKA